jgi:hypothetical protein
VQLSDWRPALTVFLERRVHGLAYIVTRLVAMIDSKVASFIRNNYPLWTTRQGHLENAILLKLERLRNTTCVP